MKIRPVFSAEYLRRDSGNPLLGQKNAPLPPIQVTTDEKYEMQEIIAVKLIQGKLVYKAK